MPCPTGRSCAGIGAAAAIAGLAILQLGGKRMFKMTGQASGVQITSVQANHTDRRVAIALSVRTEPILPPNTDSTGT